MPLRALLPCLCSWVSQMLDLLGWDIILMGMKLQVRSIWSMLLRRQLGPCGARPHLNLNLDDACNTRFPIVCVPFHSSRAAALRTCGK